MYSSHIHIIHYHMCARHTSSHTYIITCVLTPHLLHHIILIASSSYMYSSHIHPHTCLSSHMYSSQINIIHTSSHAYIITCVPAAAVCVAGAVLGASRRSCGAVSPLSRGFCLCGRRSARSLQSCGAWCRRWAVASVCVAGAVLGAFRRGCGAWCRRWAAASVCVAGAVLRAFRRGCGAWCRRWAAASVCVRSLEKGLRCAVSPLGRGFLLCATQYPEPLEGVRDFAAGPQLLSVLQAQYSEL